MSAAVQAPDSSVWADALRRRERIPLAAWPRQVVAASRALAGRLAAGGRLFALGAGASASNARHVAVEFLHPVIVGKPAVPALALLAGAGGAALGARLAALATRDDAVVALSLPGAAETLEPALALARARGLLTVHLVGAGAASGAEHVLEVGASEPRLVQELHVTAHHLLWELTHVFLEHGRAPAATAGQGVGVASGLYPFLATPSDAGDLGPSGERSVAAKLDELAALRSACVNAASADLVAAARLLADAAARGARLYAFGNGGSACDAESFAEACAPLAAHALPTDFATLSALANDVGFDVVFARPLAALARPGDVAVGFSTSGDSRNVLAGLAEARRLGLHTLAFAGYDGGRMARERAADLLFVVPSHSVHRIQEVQTALAHLLLERACAT